MIDVCRRKVTGLQKPREKATVVMRYGVREVVSDGMERRYECSHLEEKISRIWQPTHNGINNDNNS